MCKFASVETFSSIEMKIGICSDHAGLEYKTRLIAYLLRRGYEVVNFGTDSPESCDYSDFAHPLAYAVEKGEVDCGIALCGTGNGMAITLNHHQGIRAGLAWNTAVAGLVKEHNIREGSTRFLSADIADYPEGIVLPVDKPYRWTSADVVRKIKYAAIRHFGKKNLKVGHAGTLDPLATGILLVCIGPATRRAEQLQASRKQYVAEVSFGATTPSYDLEKDIDREYPLDGVSRESLESVIPRFIGGQMQVAPLFSAKSVDGVRAYETARRLFREGRLEGGSDLIRANPVTHPGQSRDGIFNRARRLLPEDFLRSGAGSFGPPHKRGRSLRPHAPYRYAQDRLQQGNLHTIARKGSRRGPRKRGVPEFAAAYRERRFRYR